MEAFNVIVKPIITEKSTKGITEEKFYTFEVNKNATKTDIRWAIETLFVESNAVVEKVNIINNKPKKRRVGKYEGKTKATKKAIVYLKSGLIPIYGSSEESDTKKKEKKQGIGSKLSSLVADSILKDKDENK